ncbi:unnamed protein product [Phytophthora fragariaefolia]|uniref:Unnamed protein product n=1 Tax=Phytophthora fragariaefolia TaxID=1490495 RepID=A0A9W6YFV8_9STRA|nr:unnamed protein product [Phytophthora fragariaefolia]
MGYSTNKETNDEHDTEAVMVDTTDEMTNAAKVDSMEKKTYAEHDANAITSDTTDEKTNSKHGVITILAVTMNESRTASTIFTNGEHDVRAVVIGKKTNGDHTNSEYDVHDSMLDTVVRRRQQ